MTRHGPALLALSIIAVAGWTYNVNYDTRAALDRLSALRAEIAEQHEALQVLRVEWAYLNAPDRLAWLVARHGETLGLAPLLPEMLGIVAAVPYPPREAPVEPDALIAAGQLPAQQPPSESAPETVTLAALSEPDGLAGPGSVAASRPSAVAEPVLAPVSMPVEAPLAEAEAVPAALEAAIAAALVEVGVSADDAALSRGARGGALAAPAASPVGILSAAASGVPLPETRAAAWGRP